MLLASTLVMGATLVGCGSSGGNSTGNDTANSTGGGSAQQTITVAADTTFPPFESMQGNNVVGFDIDMIKDIAKLENLKIDEIKTMPFTGLIPALQSGQVDVAVAGITIKKSRMGAVDFSNAYYKSGASILVKNNSNITGLNDLKGKTVATKKGTSAVDILTQAGISDIKQFDNIDQAYAALESGQADAVVFDNPVNINYKSTHNDVKIVGGLLSGEYYGIAISKHDAGLVAKINDGLQKMQANGDYQKLFDTWLGGDKNGVVDGVKAPADVALNG
ncbi:amino acid ABC transporter substrate-binding protein [Alicyclobacillus contaminans]|nr:amino acid ABC transporter substrate-binding protein [Alicyclobacillus contaminans]